MQYLDEMKRRTVSSLDDENVVRATVVDCFPSLEGKAFELQRVARHIVRVCEKKEEKAVHRKEKPQQEQLVVAQPPAVQQAAPAPAKAEPSSVAIPMDLISGALSPEELQAVVHRALATPEVQAVFARLVLETIVAKREDNAARARAREEKKRRKAECRAREQEEKLRLEERLRQEREAAQAAVKAAEEARLARLAREREEAAEKARAQQEALAEEQRAKEEREAAERAQAMAEQDRIKAQSRAEGPQVPVAELERQQAIQALKEMGFVDVATINELYARHGNNLDAIVQSLIEQSQEGRW